MIARAISTQGAITMITLPVGRSQKTSTRSSAVSGRSTVPARASCRLTKPRGIVERTSDQIVAGIFSLSSSTPHLFGNPARRSKMTLGECCTMPTRPESSASRCERSPRTFGDRGALRRPHDIPGAAR
jgi:hypothetical protein